MQLRMKYCIAWRKLHSEFVMLLCPRMLLPCRTWLKTRRRWGVRYFEILFNPEAFKCMIPTAVLKTKEAVILTWVITVQPSLLMTYWSLAKTSPASLVPRTGVYGNGATARRGNPSILFSVQIFPILRSFCASTFRLLRDGLSSSRKLMP